MPTAAKLFDKKTVYHSQLVKAGVVPMFFTARVRDSKFEGKPPFVSFRTKDDSSEHHYQVENDLCREALDVIQLDVWYDVRAEGSRDGAILNISANGQKMAAPSLAVTGTHTSSAPPPNVWNGTETDEEAPPLPGMAGRYLVSLEAAKAAVDAYRTKHGSEPSETVRNIATTIYIQSAR